MVQTDSGDVGKDSLIQKGFTYGDGGFTCNEIGELHQGSGCGCLKPALMIFVRAQDCCERVYHLEMMRKPYIHNTDMQGKSSVKMKD